MDTDSFIIQIKTEDLFKDIANDVEKWFDTSNYDDNDERPLPISKNKKVTGLFKDELGGKVMQKHAFKNSPQRCSSKKMFCKTPANLQ